MTAKGVLRWKTGDAELADEDFWWEARMGVVRAERGVAVETEVERVVFIGLAEVGDESFGSAEGGRTRVAEG